MQRRIRPPVRPTLYGRFEGMPVSRRPDPTNELGMFATGISNDGDGVSALALSGRQLRHLDHQPGSRHDLVSQLESVGSSPLAPTSSARHVRAGP
jgi:hypothetical protein